MRSDLSDEFDGVRERDSGLISSPGRNREPDPTVADCNSADEVFGEAGLILAVALGIVVAINMILQAFHVS